ncbi:hypothetical protein FOJ82_07080 [Tessaracoccus rhinocerotis]|uniref:DUF3137 domain-containing protein n=1 Tax=Tessaracoccus rhinocerotis TaxID=1689449 RepID=A0A553K2E5_9ACTN|nr:hypothetical protein [Tessaracoccus rhinocerotis]TRY18865.1 hypothetical protein FOJ82_07080 [Tessaracoccus rhinocerotis]
MESPLLWILLAVLAVGIGIGVFFVVRKHRYVKAIRAKGWTWVESPGIAIIVGLNVPPFGLGFSRSVDDQVLGASQGGTGFQAFRYRSQFFRSDGYVLTMRLPRSLPEFYLFEQSSPREAITGQVVNPGPLQAVAPDPDFGRTVFSAVAGATSRPPTDADGKPMRVDLSIDHDQLVMLHVPRDVDELATAVEWLAGVHAAIVASPAVQFSGPPAPQHLSFHGLPHWSYVPRDDSMLGLVNHTRGGRNHRAEDIVTSSNFGLPFIRLTHHWETTHTSTDSKGNTTTRTEHHSEVICEFQTTFGFHEISFNWGLFGKKLSFESTAFNDAFKVRSPSARFAHDVVHPRQMEYFLRARPVPFSIEGNGRILVERRDWNPQELAWFSDFLRGFFARVPDFTWKELGAWPRPITEVEDYNR